MSLATVQETFGLGDQVDRVWLCWRFERSARAVRKAVAARVAGRLGRAAPVRQMQLADDVLRTTELALRFAGALSMAMAAFIVLNTLRMNFSERRRDMAVLRVLGVTSRQMVGLQLVEGLALGLVGAAAGIPLGFVFGTADWAWSCNRCWRMPKFPRPRFPTGPWPAAIIVGPLVASGGVAAGFAVAKYLAGRGDGRFRNPPQANDCRCGPRLGGAAMWSLAVTCVLLVGLERLSPEAAIPAGVLMIVAFIAVIPASCAAGACLARLLAPWRKPRATSRPSSCSNGLRAPG